MSARREAPAPTGGSDARRVLSSRPAREGAHAAHDSAPAREAARAWPAREARTWTAWWCEPRPLGDLAACRVLWSALALAELASGRWAERIAAAGGAGAIEDPIPLVRVLALPLGGANDVAAGELALVLWIARLAAALALVGLFSRASLATCAVAGALLHGLDASAAYLRHDAALAQLALLLLACSPCGACASIDAWIARRRGERAVAGAPDGADHEGPLARTHAAWPLHLVHALVAIAYGSAALAKLARGAEPWLGGWTLHYHLARHALRSESALGTWLAEHHAAVTACAWLVLLLEATFPLSLWLRRHAWAWAAGSLAMHAGAALTMGVVFPSFPLLCAALVPWSAWGARLARASPARRRRRARAGRSPPERAA